jgi:hypothetical protein
VVLEGTSDPMHAVGKQRRGQGVAAKPKLRPAVEHEWQRLFAVDAAAIGSSEFHGGFGSPRLYTATK